MTTAFGIGLALYATCVDFELRLGALLGLTYRDVNAGLFFVLWPVVTVGLVGLVVVQRRAILRLEPLRSRTSRTSRMSRSGPKRVGIERQER